MEMASCLRENRELFRGVPEENYRAWNRFITLDRFPLKNKN